MGHKDKGLCLAAIELQDTSGTANAAGDYPGVGVYRPMIGMDGDAATHTIGTGSTAVTIDIKINKANCEATTAGTGIDLPLGGK